MKKNKLLDFILKKVSDTKMRLQSYEFITHVRNYFTGSVGGQVLFFMAMPIFTRLLTPEDYGKYSLFNTSYAFISPIVALAIGSAISNRYLRERKNFETFLGTSFIFILFYALGISALFYLLEGVISDFLNLDSIIFRLAVFAALITLPIYLFQVYNLASKNSKRHTVFHLSSIAISITVGITLILFFFDDNRYMGRVLGKISSIALPSFMALFYLLRLMKLRFNVSYLKSSLSYSIPLIPHILSGTLLSFSDQLIINQLKGEADTGLYSFAYNVGMIMSFIVAASNQAWVPLFYEHLNKKEYAKINEKIKKVIRIIFFVAFGLIVFSEELIKIMANEKYFDSLNIVPLIILGYVFQFLYILYANYAFYLKKTYIITIITAIAAIINIALNYWLIPIYGYKIASITTIVGFIFISAAHFFNTKYNLKVPSIRIFSWLSNLVLLLVFSAIYFYIQREMGNNLVLRGGLFLAFIIFGVRKNREY